MDIEVFLPVVGFEDLYEVSSLGVVYRIINGGTDRIPIDTFHSEINGKITCFLYPRSGRGTRAIVQNLVYEAFIGPVPSDKILIHKDGHVDNNCISNLEMIERVPPIRGKLSREDIATIRSMVKSDMRLIDVAQMFNVNAKTVRYHCNKQPQ